jgi:hypothetical protein
MQRQEEERRERELELRIKVFYNGMDVVVKCKKSDTLTHLKKECIAKLNVLEHESNLRLRVYQVHESLM